MSRSAPPTVHLIPLAEIDAEALTRDRAAAEPAAAAELQASIRDNGLRQPIEVYAFADAAPDAEDAPRYGLISGHRRLAAFTALHAAGFSRFAAIPAFLREPDSVAAAMLAMVEENEIRAQISAWEKGRIVVAARDRGVFATLDEAVERLFPTAGKDKRSRLRQLAHLVEELDGALRAPETLSQRNALRLAEACRRGFADLLRAALASSPTADPAAQWDLLAPVLAETEATRADVGPATSGRPRRLSTPRPGLSIRRERTRGGYSLHFTGRAATTLLMDAVFDEIDRIFLAG